MNNNGESFSSWHFKLGSGYNWTDIDGVEYVYDNNGNIKIIGVDEIISPNILDYKNPEITHKPHDNKMKVYEALHTITMDTPIHVIVNSPDMSRMLIKDDYRKNTPFKKYITEEECIQHIRSWYKIDNRINNQSL